MAEFLTDVETIRAHARAEVEKGPITDAYTADRERVVEVLDGTARDGDRVRAALQAPLLHGVRDRLRRGSGRVPPARQRGAAPRRSAGRQDHAAFQGEPDFSPEGLASRSHSEYVEGDSLADMLHEDLVAERVAIASYQEIIRWLGDSDPTTRVLLESILATEEEHADDLLNLLQRS